jgi:lipoprotein-anchoring transpeptidase ErfK/SrfK
MSSRFVRVGFAVAFVASAFPGGTVNARGLAPALTGQIAAVSATTPPAPADSDDVAVLRAARNAAGTRIVVSTRQRMLWLVRNRDTLMVAPVAVGMGQDFEFQGRKFHFSTPTGRRRVIGKAENPIWTVPEWHYLERASARGFEVVRLEPDSKIELADGSELVVDGDQVGRINHFGNFAPVTPGNEIIYDGKVFIPPMTTVQRRVPEALGPYKLDMGEGYLIHGTHLYNEDSIGQAVSHGCVRMNNEDLIKLYSMVPTGTQVFIY